MTKILSFIQSKGGVGKSTLLCAVALTLHNSNKRIAIIDTDKQGTAKDFAKEFNIDFLECYDAPDLVSYAEGLKKEYDTILIDTAGFDSILVSTVAKLSTDIFLPISASQPDATGIVKTYKIADFSKADHTVLKILFNKYQKTKISDWVYKNMDTYPMAKTKIPLSVAFAELHTTGILKERSLESIQELITEIGSL